MPFEIGQHDRITVCCFVLSSHCFMFDEQMGRISKSLASCPEDFIALTQKIVQMLCQHHWKTFLKREELKLFYFLCDIDGGYWFGRTKLACFCPLPQVSAKP